MISVGYNLDSDGTCNLTDSTDLPGVDPLLGPLQNNGGPTLTHALPVSSSAVDHILIQDCKDAIGNPLTTDQRGVVRPQGVGCDIGAYELIQFTGGGQPRTVDEFLSYGAPAEKNNRLLTGTPETPRPIVKARSQ